MLSYDDAISNSWYQSLRFFSTTNYHWSACSLHDLLYLHHQKHRFASSCCSWWVAATIFWKRDTLWQIPCFLQKNTKIWICGPNTPLCFLTTREISRSKALKSDTQRASYDHFFSSAWKSANWVLLHLSRDVRDLIGNCTNIAKAPVRVHLWSMIASTGLKDLCSPRSETTLSEIPQIAIHSEAEPLRTGQGIHIHSSSHPQIELRDFTILLANND